MKEVEIVGENQLQKQELIVADETSSTTGVTKSDALKKENLTSFAEYKLTH